MDTIKLGSWAFYIDGAGGLRTVAMSRPLDITALREDVGVSVGRDAVEYLARVVQAYVTASDVRRVVADADAAGL